MASVAAGSASNGNLCKISVLKTMSVVVSSTSAGLWHLLNTKNAPERRATLTWNISKDERQRLRNKKVRANREVKFFFPVHGTALFQWDSKLSRSSSILRYWAFSQDTEPRPKKTVIGYWDTEILSFAGREKYWDTEVCRYPCAKWCTNKIVTIYLETEQELEAHIQQFCSAIKINRDPSS